MFDLIKSMRIPDCLRVVAVSCISFQYTGISYSFSILLTLFLVITVTMLQNDWRDRIHDRGKNKKIASEKPRQYVSWLIAWWIVCILSIAYAFIENFASGTLLAVMAAIGALYSETRTIPLLPVTIVTLTVAGSTLFPATFGIPFIEIAPLFLAVALIMFGRETLHDIADKEVDIDYKKTIPIVFGDKLARIVSTIGLIVGCVILSVLSFYTLIGSAIIVWALLGVYKETKLVGVRKKIDFGFLVLIVILLFF